MAKKANQLTQAYDRNILDKLLEGLSENRMRSNGYVVYKKKQYPKNHSLHLKTGV